MFRVRLCATSIVTNLWNCPARERLRVDKDMFIEIQVQLGVAGSLLPKTIRDAPYNREVNRKNITDCAKYK